MKFKIDENLKMVADAKAAAPEIVSVELCARMIEKKMIADTEDNICETVLNATGPVYVSEVCGVLAEYLYGDNEHSIPFDIFNAFCEIIIIGEGDCPECGGKFDFYETEGHELKDGDRDTPNSYIVDNYVYRCADCGEIVKTPNAL